MKLIRDIVLTIAAPPGGSDSRPIVLLPVQRARSDRCILAAFCARSCS
jgi:hypothetical protein